MPSRKKPWKLHGREFTLYTVPWRDPRTRLILAPGAFQNWPTTSETREVNRARVIANEMARQKDMEARAERLRAVPTAVSAVVSTVSLWADA